MTNQLIPFEGKEIRKAWHNEQWYFSIIDVIEILTNSPSPKTYWAKLKAKEQTASGQTFPICHGLKMQAADGKKRLTDCTNTEGILRIIMSVPSPKALSLKIWIAKIVEEKLDSETIDTVISDLSGKFTDKINLPIKTYLMKDFFRDVYKIGKSTNPCFREKTLQSEVPTIKLIHIIEEDIEKHLHEKFSAKRIRGEWFNLSINDLNYITSWKMS